jgi:hypothetical protein
MKQNWLQVAAAVALMGIALGQFFSHLLSVVLTSYLLERNYGFSMPLGTASFLDLLFRAIVACFGLGFGIRLLSRSKGQGVPTF